MTLKRASLLALVGTFLLTVLLLADFILNLLSIMRGLIPVMALTSLIYGFTALSMTVFFYVFHKAQS